MSVGELIDDFFFLQRIWKWELQKSIYLIETALKESYQKFKRV